MSTCPYCRRRVPEARDLTKQDHARILRHHLNGWKRISKQGLAVSMNCTPNQVAAVCAHTRPSLGGAQYVKRFLTRALTDAEKSRILKHNANGWKRVSKKDLAKKMGCTTIQIGSVCAWTRPSLGGKKYAEKYLG